MEYKDHFSDIENEFVKWLDDEHQYSLHHVISRGKHELYAVYDEKNNFECGSCYADDKDDLVAWAKESIPHWKEKEREHGE